MSDDAPAVGIVGTGDAYAAARGRLSAATVTVEPVGLDQSRSTDGEAAGWPTGALDLVVAVGERAIADAATAGPPAPILPVGAGAGVRAVPDTALDALAKAVVDGAWDTERHRPLSVAVADDPVGTAVFDVALVTDEAAHISEYAVHADGVRLDRARADGVVVATPAGSTDYARRVDAPVLAPGTGVAVAWIAPFRTDPDRWVVEPDRLAVRVERDGPSLALQLDDRVVRSVDPSSAITLTAGEPFDVAVVDGSQQRYG